MNSAKRDDIGIRLRRLTAKAKRVTNKVRHLLDGGNLVIVCENHSIAGALKLHDF